MARKTVQNKITSEESLSKILPENKELMKDFLDYLNSIDRSPATIHQYESDLKIFFVWNYENNKNKKFVDITKREIAKFQSHALNVWMWSPKRMRRVKSVISSMSNYIENILDDDPEYENFRSIVKKIENPANEMVREKTIISDEEVDMVLNKLVENEKLEMACAFALAAFSGSRKSELARFKVEYFDDVNIMDTASLYRTPEKIKTKGRGKNGKLLYKYTLLDFKKYLDLWLEQKKERGYVDSPYIFSTKDGRQASASTFDSYTEYITNILGKSFYFHSLRHQLCTRLSRIGVPPEVIQEFFGWSSLDLISVYSDLDTSDSFGNFFTSDGIKGSDSKGL